MRSVIFIRVYLSSICLIAIVGLALRLICDTIKTMLTSSANPELSIPQVSTLDRLAIALAVMSLGFLAFVIRAPFFHAAIVGAALLGIRAHLTGKRELYVIAAFLLPLTIVVDIGNGMVVKLTPHTIDAFLLASDFGISHAVYLWFSGHPLAFAVIYAVYFWLPVWAAIVLCFTADAKRAAITMAIAPFTALPFFLAFPAVGPVRIHTATAPRNCVPSMHMVWVLLLWYYSPKWLRPIALTVVAITALATLGLGEHYVIDLAVAAPFALGVHSLVARLHATHAHELPAAAAVEITMVKDLSAVP